ncbi:helix-turn-helix domain-containing protein [Enterococcus raffinosus]|uniref:winged helix-turn-helix domain-containing protein n=1 Tax=Enterococcus raffinosus TaxID=71452 RepID=UPI001C123C40|nr:helix-turn-helix domain-containing protein [Enterococcus raffinosus]MBU5362538.1 helix-turn-helix domain-containing protein [Enterococcus raffinosus]
MGPILLLTKNVLAEEEFQKKLQHLNYEVFSSSSLLSKRVKLTDFLHFFNLFYYTIISETISDIELQQLLPVLKKSSTIIIRKNAHELENKPQDIRLNLWISNESSVEELRELLMESIYKETQNHMNQRQAVGEHGLRADGSPWLTWEQFDTQLSLSSMEKRILNELYSAKGEIVPRNDLCVRIWDGEITDSKMAMLSNAIRNLRSKLQKDGFTEDMIRTHWGRGYQLSERFFEVFSDEQNDTEEVEECQSEADNYFSSSLSEGY